MRVLVLSSVFPNGKDPLFGVFVKERIKRVVPVCDVRVVAPAAWFPFNRWFRGSKRAGIAPYEVHDGLTVYHPKVFSIPGIFKCLDGVFYFLSLWPVLRRLRREFRFDLIDAHFVYPDGLAACLLGRAFGCPVTVTLRGTIGKLAKYLLRRAQIRWVLRNATRVICVSESLREIALRLSCDPKKVCVISNGVDSQIFRPTERGAARRRLGLPLDRKIILSVGALAERKGHHRILQVLPTIVAVHPELLYVIVGGPGVEGDTGPLLQRLTEELGLQQHVRIVGARPHDEIAEWLAATDLFCLATSNEGMANVIVEALACGVPVVTTRVGGNAELIQEGSSGLLVAVGDSEALQRALLQALEKDWRPAEIAGAMLGRTWEAASTRVVHEWRASLGTGDAEVRCQSAPTAP